MLEHLAKSLMKLRREQRNLHCRIEAAKKRYERAKYANSLAKMSDTELQKVRSLLEGIKMLVISTDAEIARTEAQIVASVLDCYR